MLSFLSYSGDKMKRLIIEIGPDPYPWFIEAEFDSLKESIEFRIWWTKTIQSAYVFHSSDQGLCAYLGDDSEIILLKLRWHAKPAD